MKKLFIILVLLLWVNLFLDNRVLNSILVASTTYVIVKLSKDGKLKNKAAD